MIVRRLFVLVIAFLACPALFGQATFANFCDTSAFTLNGTSAALNPNADCVLRLTNNTGQSSSAFLTNTFSLASDASFSTFFSFRISNSVGIGDGDGQGADGFVFVVQTVANNVGGGGGGIGYSGIADSVGIEFDTFDNGLAFNDPNGNHIGIDLEGNIASVQTQTVATRMNNGAVWFAWVDYNGATDTLEVRISETNTRPVLPQMSRVVDLAAVLGQTNAFIGFTSGTGAAGNTHDILSWQFLGSFAPIGDDDVTITKTAEPSEVAVGENVVFTIVVSNTGAAAAPNVVVTDPLPSGLSFVSASSTQGTCSGTTTVTCTIGTLAALSGSATVTITTQAVSGGSLENVARATVDGQPLGEAGTTTVEVEGAAIPTVSQWGLLMLAALLAGVALLVMRV